MLQDGNCQVLRFYVLIQCMPCLFLSLSHTSRSPSTLHSIHFECILISVYTISFAIQWTSIRVSENIMEYRSFVHFICAKCAHAFCAISRSSPDAHICLRWLWHPLIDVFALHTFICRAKIKISILFFSSIYPIHIKRQLIRKRDRYYSIWTLHPRVYLAKWETHSYLTSHFLLCHVVTCLRLICYSFAYKPHKARLIGTTIQHFYVNTILLCGARSWIHIPRERERES